MKISQIQTAELHALEKLKKTQEEIALLTQEKDKLEEQLRQQRMALTETDYKNHTTKEQLGDNKRKLKGIQNDINSLKEVYLSSLKRRENDTVKLDEAIRSKVKELDNIQPKIDYSKENETLKKQSQSIRQETQTLEEQRAQKEKELAKLELVIDDREKDIQHEKKLLKDKELELKSRQKRIDAYRRLQSKSKNG